MYRALDVDLSEKTHTRLGTCHEIRLKIRCNGQVELKRQAQVRITDIHRIMHLRTRKMLILHIGAALHIHGFRHNHQNRANGNLHKQATCRSEVHFLFELTQRHVTLVPHLGHIHSTLDAYGYRLFLLVVLAHLSRRNGAHSEQQTYHQKTLFHRFNLYHS